MQQSIEHLADDPESEGRYLFHMCDEIKMVAQLPRSMYHLMSSRFSNSRGYWCADGRVCSDKHLPTQYDDGVTDLISAVRGYLKVPNCPPPTSHEPLLCCTRSGWQLVSNSGHQREPT